LNRARPPLAAALVLLIAAAPARANPSLDPDFANMSQWLSDQLAQGLAFNAGENFDPPTLVKGYYLQPDISLGAGIVPLNKATFPDTPRLAANNIDAASLFPNSVQFPNLALHLRMGLPGNNDVYVRFADATVPAGYKISPSMTAAVQTNSIGAGVRHHFLGDDGWPNLVVGLHYNHVQGHVDLTGPYALNVTSSYGYTGSFTGEIKWSINSVGTDAILYQSYGRWTPFGGLGFNHASGSVETTLNLDFGGFGTTPVNGVGSDEPKESQGRAILGTQYQFATWTLFGSGEIKTIGSLPFKNYIAQVGAALPFEIGCGRTFFCKKNRGAGAGAAPAPRDESEMEVVPESKAAPAPAKTPPPPDAKSPSGMIFLQ